MKRLFAGLCALAVLAGDVGDASAAWNNVFQPTLFGRLRRQKTTVQYVAVPAQTVVAQSPCDPCPQKQCTTKYVQRCYYQPVTNYETKSYYQQVTSYRTSYYYEPVTSYRYSCYYDPCSCSYKQVAVPTTCYQLRSKQCPVTSWVQRCCRVPVTSYRKCCYWVPQTTCCETTEGAPVQQAPIQQAPVQQPIPKVDERNLPAPPPGAPPEGSATRFRYDRNFTSTPSPSYQTSNPWNRVQKPQPTPAPQPAPPSVKLNRIVVGPNRKVEGQVVRSDNTPKPNARLLFVSANRQAPNQTATANSAGRFYADLPAGGWLVYLEAADGTRVYHSRIDVNGVNSAPIRLISFIH